MVNFIMTYQPTSDIFGINKNLLFAFIKLSSPITNSLLENYHRTTIWSYEEYKQILKLRPWKFKKCTNWIRIYQQSRFYTQIHA